MLKAVITGVAGQDGSYLAEYLLANNYEIIGITRRKSVDPCIDNILGIINHPNFTLIHGDITDPTFISRILHEYHPEEFYNLAAQSHVGQSFKEPIQTFKTNSEAVLMHLEFIRQISPYTRYLQASTSEIFGGISCPKSGYTEDSMINPRSPYAISKVSAFYTVKNYREAYEIFSVNSIAFNHSSIRRGLDFATRKITRGIASVKLGLEKTIKMGNLSPFRDEGSSEDYVRAMHLMLQQKDPEDFLIATGSGATIEEMFRFVCELANLKFEDVYEQDPKFMRPSDVPFLLGNPSKAKEKLKWKPEYTWKDLLTEMYINDYHNLQNKGN